MEYFLYDSPAFKTYLRENPHEQGEVKFLQSVTEKNRNVVDVKGYIGLTTVTMAKEVSKVYAFEPVPEYSDILKKKLSEIAISVQTTIKATYLKSKSRLIDIIVGLFNIIL